MAGIFGSGGSGTVGTYDESMLPGVDPNYAASTSAQDASALSNLSGGGMNWAGLSTGLANLSKNLGGTSSGSNTLQTSPSVSGTVSGGTMQPLRGSDSGALASMMNSRNQLAQALIQAAMTGKGRGKSGGGLLG